MENLAGIVIMHVPGFDQARDANVAELLATFEKSGIQTRVARDPLMQGILLNYRQAQHLAAQFLESSPGSDWVMIMQDDSVPLENWEHHLAQALKHAPAPIVSLCHFSNHGQRYAERGFAYSVHEHSLWGQAVTYHRRIFTTLRQVTDDLAEMNYEKYRKWDDGIAGIHNAIYGEKACFTTRAIFDHMFVPSTVGNVPGRHRHPQCTIETMPDLPWDAPVKFRGHKMKPVIQAAIDELLEWRETHDH